MVILGVGLCYELCVCLLGSSFMKCLQKREGGPKLQWASIYFFVLLQISSSQLAWYNQQRWTCWNFRRNRNRSSKNAATYIVCKGRVPKKKLYFYGFFLNPPPGPPPPPPGRVFLLIKKLPIFFLSEIRSQMGKRNFTFGPIPKF